MTVYRDSWENRNLEQTDKIVASPGAKRLEKFVTDLIKYAQTQ